MPYALIDIGTQREILWPGFDSALLRQELSEKDLACTGSLQRFARVHDVLLKLLNQSSLCILNRFQTLSILGRQVKSKMDT